MNTNSQTDDSGKIRLKDLKLKKVIKKAGKAARKQFLKLARKVEVKKVDTPKVDTKKKTDLNTTNNPTVPVEKDNSAEAEKKSKPVPVQANTKNKKSVKNKQASKVAKFAVTSQQTAKS
ncbi:hypothetical protein QNI16_38245 [Cytophagaceae bacterium YF14B1]|uniref:Uncharacterized protein n=1 Tax=Xanthocytophaga flava TaxID=3048013 RepID=A0AAE3R1H6_9BACT|nr:hypothetical protein [Xanthocytophaga flavus]MDJ1486383.1 hypothetical protein [Xanthocytophaga flavus]